MMKFGTIGLSAAGVDLGNESLSIRGYLNEEFKITQSSS
jgi:hypothetical protein